MEKSKVADLKLASLGEKKIQWAQAHMPVMQILRSRAEKEKPLQGMRIAGCLHVTKETAVLVETLKVAGAEVAWSGCNPLSTQDDIAAALAQKGISIYAWHGMDREAFYWAIERSLDFKPTLTLDDGADLIFTVHQKHPELFKTILGGTEETTTGVHRLRSMAAAGALKYPVIAVNDAETKWDFDNIYGTGQSSLDGILRATNILFAGKVFVVAGYGHCGKGCAMRARGMGARVVVTEVKPMQALKAVMDGFEVLPMKQAASIGDVFLTATGMKDVITKTHFEHMKNAAVVCNTGHYDCEVNLKDLQALAEKVESVRPNNQAYVLKNGNVIYALAQGRLVNLASAEGHPSEVMDMSFANQFLSLCKLAKEGGRLKTQVYPVDSAQDERVALLKLQSMGMKIDTLSEEQKAYANAFEQGT